MAAGDVLNPRLKKIILLNGLIAGWNSFTTCLLSFFLSDALCRVTCTQSLSRIRYARFFAVSNKRGWDALCHVINREFICQEHVYPNPVNGPSCKIQDCEVPQFTVLKPNHVSQFMSDDGRNPLLVGVGGERHIVQQCRLSVCDQTPVLHGSSIKVWESYLICVRKEVIRGWLPVELLLLKCWPSKL